MHRIAHVEPSPVCALTEQGSAYGVPSKQRYIRLLPYSMVHFCSNIPVVFVAIVSKHIWRELPLQPCEY